MKSNIRQFFIILSRNQKSVLFLKKWTHPLPKSLLLKLKKSIYDGDKKFLGQYNESINLDKKEDVNGQGDSDIEEMDLPVVLRKVNQPTHVSGTLRKAYRPFQAFQADVADFNFTKPSAADPHFVLICVDLFTQKIFTYGYKRKSQLPTVLEKFLIEIQKERNFFAQHHDFPGNRTLSIQTDEEFTNNNAISELTKKYDVNLYSSNINGGHASAAEQKVKVIKENMTNYLQSGNFKNTNKGKILNKITDNANNTVIAKYGIVPNDLITKLKKNIKGVDLYNMHRLKIIAKSDRRRTRMYTKRRNSRKDMLRKLKINDRVLVAAGRIRKTDYPSRLDKVTTNKKPYFDKHIKFKVTSVIKIDKDNFLYKIRPITNIDNLRRDLKHERFTREELYAISRNKVPSSTYSKN